MLNLILLQCQSAYRLAYQHECGRLKKRLRCSVVALHTRSSPRYVIQSAQSLHTTVFVTHWCVRNRSWSRTLFLRRLETQKPLETTTPVALGSMWTSTSMLLVSFLELPFAHTCWNAVVWCQSMNLNATTISSTRCGRMLFSAADDLVRSELGFCSSVSKCMYSLQHNARSSSHHQSHAHIQIHISKEKQTSQISCVCCGYNSCQTHGSLQYSPCCFFLSHVR